MTQTAVDPSRSVEAPGPLAPGMPALTLWQPWASLIAIGAKSIETRSWPAPAGLVGERIAIHAAANAKPGIDDLPGDCEGKTEGGWTYGYLGDYQACYALGGRTAELHQITAGRGINLLGGGIQLPLGAVVATARLAACVPMVAERIDDEHVLVLDDELWLAESAEQEHHQAWASETLQSACRIDDQLPYGDFRPGRWAWILDDVQALADPVPARGRQRIWRWQP